MKLQEIIAYTLGTIIILYGSYAGRDLTNWNEIIEGTGMIVLFIGIFLIFVYMKRRGFVGDWKQPVGNNSSLL